MSIEKERLWSRNFIAAGCGNFMLFFAFYLILPILPIYLTEQFAASKSAVGVILASYTITALLIRPFGGYMVDTFPRKRLLLICYLIFILFFGGYLVAGTLLFFAVVRATHGLAFGMLSVSNSTVAIDVMPSSRRGEGIGYFGVTSNLAMACGPTVALYILDASHNYNYIFLTSLFAGILGFICVTTIKLPERKVDKAEAKEPMSLDRFFLIKGISAAISLALLSFTYGILSTYVAVYGKEELNIESGSGLFFILMAGGLIISRITSGRLLNKGYITGVISSGILFLIGAVSLFAFVKFAWSYYASAVVFGLAYGLICPSIQTLFINLAHHNQRGTANSTYFTSWDLGVGSGVLIGGSIAEMSDYTHAYACGLVLIVIGFCLFRWITIPHFEKNKLR